MRHAIRKPRNTCRRSAFTSPTPRPARPIAAPARHGKRPWDSARRRGNSTCATTSPGLQQQTCGWLHGQPVNPPEKPASLTAHVYQNVAGIYCRTCHVALPLQKNIEQFNDWMAPSVSPEVQLVVANNLMPFAEVPYNRYWNDSLAKNQFNSLFSSKPSACVNSCDTCGIQCNLDEQTCLASAHSVSERQQCIRAQTSCTASCSSNHGSCVNACSY